MIKFIVKRNGEIWMNLVVLDGGRVEERLSGKHIRGKRLFSCAQCDTFLTNRNELISTRFTGATGRAFLFNKVVNLRYR